MVHSERFGGKALLSAKMKTNSFRIGFFPLLFGLVVTLAVGEEPERLRSLKESYHRELQRVAGPVTKKYESALEALMESYAKAGNLEAALSVKAELEKLKEAASGDQAVDKSNSTEPTGMMESFKEWLDTVEFHDKDGRWQVSENEVTQFRNSGETKVFKRLPIIEAGKVPFEAFEQTSSFELDEGREKGIRRSEKWTNTIPFTVEPRKDS